MEHSPLRLTEDSFVALTNTSKSRPDKEDASVMSTSIGTASAHEISVVAFIVKNRECISCLGDVSLNIEVSSRGLVSLHIIL